MSELRTPVVILGAGGYAGVVYEILRMRPDVTVLGSTDKALGLSERSHSEETPLPILGDDDFLPELADQHENLHAILGLGPDLMSVRARLVYTLQRQGIPQINAIHPQAIVSEDAVLGSGAVIRAGAVVSSRTVFGDACAVCVGATIDHHVTLGTNVFVGQGAHISSYVYVGDHVVIEIGTMINRRVVIGEGARITGGAFVNTDVPARAVVVGVPGRVVRYLDE